METNFLEDSFEQQNYDEIKEKFDKLYLELFRTMLDYKNVSNSNEENNFEYLDSLVRMNYPQFSQTLIELSVSRNEPSHTYLDVINTLLSTYIHLKDMYKDEGFEKKYLECNPNNGEDVIL